MLPHYTIQVTGLDEQIARLARTDKEVKKELKRALGSGLKVVRSEVLPHVPSYSGLTKRSFKSSIKPVNGYFQGRFYNKHKFYLRMIDVGRSAGAPMPGGGGIPEKLSAWVIEKLNPAASEVRNTIFMVARAIGRRGIEGKNIMGPAWERSRERVITAFQLGVKRITEMLSNRSNGA